MLQIRTHQIYIQIFKQDLKDVIKTLIRYMCCKKRLRLLSNMIESQSLFIISLANFVCRMRSNYQILKFVSVAIL